MNNYFVNFVNLVSGEFHQVELNNEELNKLKREHIQVLDIMKVKV